jgi:IS5 family transposase
MDALVCRPLSWPRSAWREFLLDLSDRQAAEAVRCGIDFTYALALELDDSGFHHSVLADFRDRLVQGDRVDRLLDLPLARLKEAGLVRERGTQRTDSTHVLAAVRDLTRLELITEAVRAALKEIAGAAPQLLVDLVDEQWGRRYSRPVRLGRNPTKPKTRITNAGNDALQLLEHLHTHGTGHAFGPRVQTMRPGVTTGGSPTRTRHHHRAASESSLLTITPSSALAAQVLRQLEQRASSAAFACAGSARTVVR